MISSECIGWEEEILGELCVVQSCTGVTGGEVLVMAIVVFHRQFLFFPVRRLEEASYAIFLPCFLCIWLLTSEAPGREAANVLFLSWEEFWEIHFLCMYKLSCCIFKSVILYIYIYICEVLLHALLTHLVREWILMWFFFPDFDCLYPSTSTGVRYGSPLFVYNCWFFYLFVLLATLWRYHGVKVHHVICLRLFFCNVFGNMHSWHWTHVMKFQRLLAL